MTRALVTGAGGFIGHALCDELVRLGWQVRAVSRGEPTSADRSVIFCEDLAVIPPEHLDDWLDGVDVVFHLAGRAHRNDKGTERERYERYRHDNVATTRSLFAAAQRNSVGRFIFVSSIKVLGDVSEAPLRPDDDPDPQDVYAQTKLEAERSLEDARASGSNPGHDRASAARLRPRGQGQLRESVGDGRARLAAAPRPRRRAPQSARARKSGGSADRGRSRLRRLARPARPRRRGWLGTRPRGDDRARVWQGPAIGPGAARPDAGRSRDDRPPGRYTNGCSNRSWSMTTRPARRSTGHRRSRAVARSRRSAAGGKRNVDPCRRRRRHRRPDGTR